MPACVLRIGLVAWICLAGRAAGQAAASPDLRVLFLRSLRTGRAVRINGRDFGRITAAFEGVSDSALSLGGQAGRRVPIAGIDSIWVSQRHSATGAVVGSVVGLVAGVIAISGKTCNFGDSCQSAAYVESAGIALSGTVMGALIGGGVKSWHLRFP